MKIKIPEELSWKNQAGKLGWIVLWAIGIPIPVLIVLWIIRGGT